jgi:UMF1 family MFS transporter
LIVTFIYSTYFVEYMSGSGRTLGHVWTNAVAITAIVVALLSPLLGAIADRGGYRKRFLLSFSATCVLATAVLAGAGGLRREPQHPAPSSHLAPCSTL